jgi:serine/threonine protein kinase
MKEMSHIGSSNRYEYVAKIGSGAFGEVSLCFDTINKTQVAVKSIHSSGKSVGKNVLREIGSLKQLCAIDSESIYVVKLLDLYVDDETRVCEVFEYLPGDLTRLTSSDVSKLARSCFKSFALSMMKALDFCHSSGFIHR